MTQEELRNELGNAAATADTVSIVFHPTGEEIMIFYSKKGNPIGDAKQMIFQDLETALMFVRGIKPVQEPAPKNMPQILDKPQEIGFLSKAA